MGQPLNKVKGNRSVGKSGKVNSAILYRNELCPEKQTITQELYGQEFPGDQVAEKFMTPSLRTKEKKRTHEYIHDLHYVVTLAACKLKIKLFYYYLLIHSTLYTISCHIITYSIFTILSKIESCFAIGVS